MINQRFDRFARLTVDVDHRRLPLFRSLGIVGFQMALLVHVLTLLRIGLPLTFVVVAGVTTAASFFGWGFVRRALTGSESYAQLEHIWVALLTLAAVAWLIELPVATVLDSCSVPLAVFLAFGRLGCLSAGCCHGTPSGLGIVYPTDTHGEVVRPRFLDRRLFPVQFVESVALVCIAAVGFVVVREPAGTAVTWFLVSYGALRFGTESLRGDLRPRLGSISIARWMSVVQVGAALVGYELWVLEAERSRLRLAAAIGAAVAMVAGVALTRSRAANPLVDDDHLDEAWERIRVLVERGGEQPSVDRTGRGMVLVVSADGVGSHVSISHPDHDVAPVAVALGEGDFVERNGVVHLRIDDHRPAFEETPAPEPHDGPITDVRSYFDRPSRQLG